MKKITLSHEKDIAPLAIQALGGMLIVPLQHDLYERTLKQLEVDVLQKIQETQCYHILMDISEISLMDSYAYQRLVDIIGMIGLMGGRVLIVGMQPGVASALATLDIDTDHFDTVISMDEGYKRFQDALSPTKQGDIVGEEEIEDNSNEIVDDEDKDVDLLQEVLDKNSL